MELIETATPQTYYETTRRRFGMIGPAAPYFMPKAPYTNFWLVGDTVCGRFGVDAIVTSARITTDEILARGQI